MKLIYLSFSVGFENETDKIRIGRRLEHFLGAYDHTFELK